MREQDTQLIMKRTQISLVLYLAKSRRQISLNTVLKFRELIDDDIPTAGHSE